MVCFARGETRVGEIGRERGEGSFRSSFDLRGSEGSSRGVSREDPRTGIC